MSRDEIRASGRSDKGKVRKENEDALLIESQLGLYAVLDGMGGAMAGDVASSMARDVILDYVRAHRGELEGKDLIEAAVQTANSTVHREAKQRMDRRGMGTTVVACLVEEDGSAYIAHVGDSRAYLLRDGRMQQLTRDHTIVADLLAKNILSPAEAEHHPYSNVLSRNLGSKPFVQVDILHLPLQPGDRLLLCSDGLTGYASGDAIEQVLGGSDGSDHTAQDLVDLALRGGGGDNVTALIIDAGDAELREDTQIIRTSGADAWLRRRAMFLEAAQQRGMCSSPVCSVLSIDEALEIVAGNLCEAVFHDLEQTTGINVWTFAENLSKGWFDQEGDYGVLRDLIDILRGAADDVLIDIAASGHPHAVAIDAAVTRALIVAEMVIGGLVAEKLRAVEAELVQLTAEHTQKTGSSGEFSTQIYMDQATVPDVSVVPFEPATPEVAQCLDSAREMAAADLGRTPGRALAQTCLDRAHDAARDALSRTMLDLIVQELLKDSVDQGISPLLDALDQARLAHFDAIKSQKMGRTQRATALRRVAIAHRHLMYSVATQVVAAQQPVTDELQAALAKSAELRAQVGKGEARLAELERRHASRKQNKPTNRKPRSRL